MHIVVVGVNHRSAPIEVRERLAFSSEQMPKMLARLRKELGLEEAAILSTCNRVEIYGMLPSHGGAVERLEEFLSGYGGLPHKELIPRLYRLWDSDTVRHLFRVASGLDSMVLGEAEILQQVKAAYETARLHGAVGKTFNGLFQRALNTAKSVRSQTGIGRGGMSVGSVAVELAQKIFSRLSETTVLLIGAGKIGELTLKRLADRGVRRIRLMNRSLERAAALAAQYTASAVPLEHLALELLDAEIVVTSTSAPGHLLTQADIAQTMRTRHQRPLCVVDLGVPRNVEPSVGALENVYLFDVDDLKGLLDHHHRERQAAVASADVIVDQKVAQFVSWWETEVQRCEPSSSALAAAR
jgi:glutamyl-tRNA reductase